MKSVCIFCGSANGNSTEYIDIAKQTGRLLADSNITLIYGGGRVGLMGAVADAALEHGGKVVGVMPRSLVEQEIAHDRLTELHVVDSMHQRKTLMAQLADGFITLPGGCGTMEELFEQWTWAQLGIHNKPCSLLNVAGYFDPLIDMIQKMTTSGFLRREYLEMLVIDISPAGILKQFKEYQPPKKKWQQ
ncbi:TIGR00730 family Rossman fold protein [Shewanella sp. C32]|uniref:Cytokinin riboside 5'-monophosphate phosphoribohydrolase n=1 Tax=Shewanella electrica TaxID=515560 RepID=A0ABT2FQF1_9GAMM|nr:TIGR00730 family Rossman fold protein [Shewanella electrica]MCH1926959.1 TIGR00730 family Rossman fold protein [Shewanella electrica]MCS4558580.1 TIGR00730 family Rossman fold protein [Shewanella electrica]